MSLGYVPSVDFAHGVIIKTKPGFLPYSNQVENYKTVIPQKSIDEYKLKNEALKAKDPKTVFGWAMKGLL